MILDVYSPRPPYLHVNHTCSFDPRCKAFFIVFPELLPDTQNLKVCFLSLASLAQILKQPKSCIQTKRLHCIIHTLKYDHYFRQCPCLSVLNVCSFSLFHSKDHLAFELISTYWLAWVTKINKGYQIGPQILFELILSRISKKVGKWQSKRSPRDWGGGVRRCDTSVSRRF